MKKRTLFLSIALFLQAQYPVFSQDKEPYRIQRIEGEIVLDGLSNETAWSKVTPLPLVMYQPVFMGQATERTEILVAYDNDYIYVAGRMYDSDPSGIRINTMLRDRDTDSDFLNVIIDTYNDNETAVSFSTTPGGNRQDVGWSNDSMGPAPFNYDWNTYWDTEVVVNDEGWFAEMRIPFSSLRFQDTDGKVVMGLITHRLISRKNERLIFPAIPPNWQFGKTKPSRAQDVLFEGIYSKRTMYVTPYSVASYLTENTINDAQTRYANIDDEDANIGLDIKYTITSNLNLDVTVNTDFAQVEADEQQLNISRFSLFFPEKRQFFQERSSIFAFNTGDNSRLFHSRRIGIADDGREISIYGGASLTGRVGGWDLGFIDMQTEKRGDFLSENFGVLRAKKRLFNQFSYVGGMLTNRLKTNGERNTNIGIDGVINLKDNDYLSFNWVQTFEKDGHPDFFDRGRFRLLLERRNNVGFEHETEIVSSGKHYDPQVGFVLRNDFLKLANRSKYGWWPRAGSSFRRITAYSYTNSYIRNSDDELETFTLSQGLNAELKTGEVFDVFFDYVHESLLSGFSIPSGATVPGGTYDYATYGALYKSSISRLFRPALTVFGGDYYDGTLFQSDLNFTWFQSKHLELNGTFTYNRIIFDDRNEKAYSRLGGLKVWFAKDVKLSLNSFIQYNSVENKVLSNLRVRYNFSEGNDLYLVYNENMNTDRERLQPRLPLSNNRIFML